MTHDSWIMIHDLWFMIHDSWLMTHDSWLIMHDSWYMTHDSWVLYDNFGQKPYHLLGTNCFARFSRPRVSQPNKIFKVCLQTPSSYSQSPPRSLMTTPRHLQDTLMTPPRYPRILPWHHLDTHKTITIHSRTFPCTNKAPVRHTLLNPYHLQVLTDQTYQDQVHKDQILQDQICFHEVPRSNPK